MTKSNDDCINIQGDYLMRKLGLATLLTFAFTSSGCFFFNTSPTPEELEQQFDNAAPERLIANYGKKCSLSSAEFKKSLALLP